MTLADIGAEPRVVRDDRYEHDSRWRTGERFHELFLEVARTRAHHPAVDLDERILTFGDVAARSRTLARCLHTRGVVAGDHVALLLDDAIESFAAMLAVSRLGAVYVPLDVGFPDDRVAYICQDAAVSAVLACPQRRATVSAPGAVVIDTSTVAEPTDTGSDDSLPVLAASGVDDAAYVIYTSGTTGRPKGVSVAHAAICNFLRVAGEVYGYRPDDRVYQGMSVAFDFSMEESWVPWLSGATLVPRPSGTPLVGDELAEFLRSRSVTALCCVPTLLTTLDETTLEQLRLVLVSGEACPQDLVSRWHRRERRMLNLYGPTEATVTATWTQLHPDRPVTLGRPLPTYSVVVLDPDAPRTVEPGTPGEIGIAGPGLALGYLGRPDLTSRAFIEDFVGLEHNPSGRIYRTGDLGTITPDGEVTYLGRIDTQVKIRGYRIELTEIESVLLTVPGVAAAVVDTWCPTPDAPELVAYYTTRADGPEVDEDVVHARLRELLPPYMVPGWFEHLERIPLTTSDKVDRRALPAPTRTRRAAGVHVPAATDTEARLAAAMTETLGLPDTSVVADVFADLGANSLLLARFCAAARDGGLKVSIRDVYRNPTIRGLAAALDAAAPSEPSAPVTPNPVRRARTSAFVLTGVAQVAFLLGYVWLMAAGGAAGYDALSEGDGVLDRTLRLGGLAAATVIANVLVPIVLKWLLVGRWRPGHIDLWSPAYLRFWVVKTAVRASVMGVLAGTPLYSAYLRALGVRVGPRALVLTRHIPVCTDLVEIGADAVVGREVLAAGYRAEAGRLQLGSVRIGAGAFVGENTVLDIDTVIGDSAELAHASALPIGATVPPGETWHGSPAEPAADGVRYRDPLPEVRVAYRRLRVTLGALAQLVGAIVFAGAFMALDVALYGPGESLPAGGAFLVDVAASAALLLLLVAGSLLAAFLVPRLVRRVLRPDTVYPSVGRHHSLLRLLDVAGNRPFLVTLFGDSSLITGYQRRVGWTLDDVEQTGSNFGTTHRQDVPFLTGVGRGTMISDGLSVANVTWSSTGFRLGRVDIGRRAFLGNKIVYPAGARLGDNVLLATKVLVPRDGTVRHDVGLLGSPAFEIPRSTHGEHVLDLPPAQLNARLLAKRRHNIASMALLLVVRWLDAALLGAIGLTAAARYDRLGPLAVALAVVVAVPAQVLLLVTAERAARRWRPLQPRTCSISEPAFWRHERLWKLLTPYLAVLDGTPLKPVALRLAGVSVGRRLFDDGAAMPEHTLVRIGDDCTLGHGCTIQCHSLEDGRFTSERTSLGDGVTVGAGGFVHYGVELGDRVVVAPDSFVMKGSRAAPDARWHGNPAVPRD